jgi:asparagine synthase (glutamine-hydrolysing)
MLVAQKSLRRGRVSVDCQGRLTMAQGAFPLLQEQEIDSPLAVGGGGSLTLLADIRLDNREELFARLGLSKPGAEHLSDATLLLKAWERWQEGSLQHIVGDYAFSLWDARTERLVLARDYLGQKPLCFHSNRNFFAFASMPSGLHALPEIPYALDRAQLARFVDRTGGGGRRTFFTGVEQVPAGHLVSITRDGIRAERYWTPSLEPLRLKQRSDYVEAVRESLDRAVAACLRAAGGEVGAHLSAGLDSGGVAATAARTIGNAGKLVCFTAVPREGFSRREVSGRINDEGPLAAATAAMYPNIEHVLVRSEKSPLSEFDRSFELFQRPLPNPCNYAWASSIQDAAAHRGLRVVLIGQFGNFSFSHSGMEALPQLLSSGRLLPLARQSLQLARRGVHFRSIASQALGPLLPASWWRAVQRLRGRGAGRLSFSLARERGGDTDVQGGGGAVNYARQPYSDGVAVRLGALQQLDLGSFNKGILAGWGLDMRDPTADRRLVELSLRIPPEQFLLGGVPRGLAREVLADRLPPVVTKEERRGYQSADWFETLDAARVDVEQEVTRLGQSSEAQAVLDMDRLVGLVSNWPTRWDGDAHVRLYRGALLRALSAGHFARRVEQRSS